MAISKLTRGNGAYLMSETDDNHLDVEATADEVGDVPPTDQPQETEEQPPSEHMGDLFVGLFLILVSVLGGWESINMSRGGVRGILTSPGLTPLLVAVALIVLSIILIGKALRGGAIAEIPVRLKKMWGSYQTHRVLILAVIMTGYVLLIGVLDFRLVTFLFMLVTCSYVRSGRWYTILSSALAGTVLATIVLPYFFNMPVP